MHDQTPIPVLIVAAAIAWGIYIAVCMIQDHRRQKHDH